MSQVAIDICGIILISTACFCFGCFVMAFVRYLENK